MGGTHRLPCTPGTASTARGAQKGARRGARAVFFPPNARSTEAKEEKQPVGEQSLESSSSPRCKQRGPTHRALKATAVPSPQKTTAEGTEK